MYNMYLGLLEIKSTETA